MDVDPPVIARMIKEAQDNYDWWVQLVDPQSSICLNASNEAAALMQAIGKCVDEKSMYLRKLREIHMRDAIINRLDNVYVDYGIDKFRFDFPVAWYLAERIRSKKWF